MDSTGKKTSTQKTARNLLDSDYYLGKRNLKGIEKKSQPLKYSHKFTSKKKQINSARKPEKQTTTNKVNTPHTEEKMEFKANLESKLPTVEISEHDSLAPNSKKMSETIISLNLKDEAVSTNNDTDILQNKSKEAKEQNSIQLEHGNKSEEESFTDSEDSEEFNTDLKSMIKQNEKFDENPICLGCKLDGTHCSKKEEIEENLKHDPEESAVVKSTDEVLQISDNEEAYKVQHFYKNAAAMVIVCACALGALHFHEEIMQSANLLLDILQENNTDSI